MKGKVSFPDERKVFFRQKLNYDNLNERIPICGTTEQFGLEWGP